MGSRAKLRSDLALASTALARDDRAEPLLFVQLSQEPQRLGDQSERLGDLAHADGLVGHEPDQDGVAIAIVAHEEAADERTPDEHVALLAAVNHAPRR